MTMTEPTSTEKMTTLQYVYPFAQGLPVPPLNRELLGGKGKNLAEMVSIGIPVPPGFIVTTEACNDYRKLGRKYPDGLEAGIDDAMKTLEKIMGAKFGGEDNPLLVAVRSGARVSMPGMMDTVLNLGLNDKSVVGFAKITNNERLAYDSYRRLIMMYADVVQGVSKKYFEDAFNIIKMEENVKEDYEVSVEGFKRACDLFLKIYQEHVGEAFPQDARQQLMKAIAAVFNSWDCERATLYRHLHHYPDDWGTAVNVQTMVFGNRGNNSATGVGFTRDPATGKHAFYGEYLINSQGEEVVAGVRTPYPLNKHQKETMGIDLASLEETLPEAYQELAAIVERLEHHYNDMQDVEFTVDDGRLFMLQTRTGKRTGFAAVRMAVEMLEEGLIDEKTALLRVQPDQLVQLLAPIFEGKSKENAGGNKVARGYNAGPGAASGRVALTSAKASEYRNTGARCILVREETNPDDFPGMVASEGILTIRGGATSHAAVVARGMGKPCVCGCGALHIDERSKTITAGGKTIKEGDWISIDGTTGEVFFCALDTSPSEIVQVLVDKTKKPEDSLLYQQYAKIMELADKYRRLEVRTNADTPYDCGVARAFGAQGIGLVRTEHMFLETDRLLDVRRMFFSTSSEERQIAIDKLKTHQKGDFVGIFQKMDGLPVTIRLLDPPLHEFMPHTEEEIEAVAAAMGMPINKLLEIKNSLHESNPMMGHRGCRLGVLNPELTKMQVRAILEAAIEVKNQGKTVYPEIMVPLVSTEAELKHQKLLIDQTAQEVFADKGTSVHYGVGTMIELPRAALTADAIAHHAEFFSFGTNDLTQTTFGISRDDSGKFVPPYVWGVPHPTSQDADERLNIFPYDPFQVLDKSGVGQLMEIAIARGKQTRPDLHCGICGEHGGEPQSVEFCHEIGLDYVSCSPYRVPIARVAAGHAALKEAE
jgi:pyruvate,orthophosphate dikinase